jgi:hypothetical protein
MALSLDIERPGQTALRERCSGQLSYVGATHPSYSELRQCCMGLAQASPRRRLTDTLTTAPSGSKRSRRIAQRQVAAISKQPLM